MYDYCSIIEHHKKDSCRQRETGYWTTRGLVNSRMTALTENDTTFCWLIFFFITVSNINFTASCAQGKGAKYTLLLVAASTSWLDRDLTSPRGLPVNSSHGQVVTWSTCHRRISSHSQPVTSEHTTRHRQCRAFRFGYLGLMSLAMTRIICDNVGAETWKKRDVAHTCTTWQVNCSVCNIEVTKSLATAKLLRAKNARSKSTVNLSQRRQTRWSTRHTVWRVDWFPQRAVQSTTCPVCELTSPRVV